MSGPAAVLSGVIPPTSAVRADCAHAVEQRMPNRLARAAWRVAAPMLAAVGLSLMPAAYAASWPTKPVRLVAVFPPGGSVDQVARAIAPQLASQIGQNVIVENKGGASGSIGTQAVAKGETDGHVFAVVFDTHATNPSLIPNLGYDTLKDLVPVVLVGTSPMVIVAHASQPWKSFADVLAAARAKPGAVAYGTIGSGSLGHLAMTQIGNQVGVEFNHVAYRGGGPLVTDAVGGQVPLSIGTVFLMSPHIKSGKLRPLGVTSTQPDPQLPAVAPVAAQGVPGFAALAWWGVFAPAATPPEIVRRASDEIIKALRTAAVSEKLAAQGLDLAVGGPDELDRFLRGEISRWAQVIRDNKIRAGD